MHYRCPPALSRIASVATVMMLAATASASAQRGTNIGYAPHSTIVVSDTREGPGVGINNPFYLPPRTSGIHSGIANLNLNFSGGLGGCTGSLLGTGRHVLTAAHCVTNPAGVIEATGGTVRFRNPNSGANADYQVSAIAVKTGYSGEVIDGKDVAILTLSDEVASYVQRYNIATTYGMNEVVRFAGFGGTGTGFTGDGNFVDNDQFGNNYVLREGFNVFQNFCSAVPSSDFLPGLTECSTSSTNGAIWMSDFTDPDFEQFAGLCTVYGRCGPGLGSPNEVMIGRGDSGGAAFNLGWDILGVASWGAGGFAGFSSFDAIGGHACVANIAGAAECQENYNWIQSQIAQQVVPEPSTYAMLALGLVALGGMARRRREQA